MSVFSFGRKVFCCLLACCVLAGVVLPQRHIAVAQPLPDRRPLTGRVTQVDGKPIKGAQIVLRKQEDLFASAYWGALTVSDENGLFSFPEAEEGTYFLTVEAGGFAPEQNRTVQLNESATPVNITLPKLVPFALRILKPDGTPLKEARVTVRLRGEGARGQRFPSGKTGDKGLFSFTANEGSRTPLIPGKYSVGIVAPGVGYANVDNIDVQASAAVSDKAPLTVDVTLQAGGTLQAIARAVGEGSEPRPVGGATLSLSPLLKTNASNRAAGEIGQIDDMGSQIWFANYNGGAPLITRDGDGVVELSDLPVGRYSARLILPGMPPLARQEVEITTNGTSTLNFDFPIAQPAAELRVTIKDNKGKPLANTDVELNLRQSGGDAGTPPPLPPDAIHNGAISVPGMLFRRGRTNEEGQLVLFPLPLGKWGVRLLGEEPDRPGRRRELSASYSVTVTKEGGSLTINANIDKP